MALEREAKQTSDVPAASSQDIGKMLELVKGSTSVELKMTVPDTNHRAAIRGLGFDPVEAQPRQAYFFDTPDLALNQAGMIVRARRIQGGRGDTVVKLRPVDPATIDNSLRRSQGFKIELDAMPGGFVCSASFKGVCTAQEALDVAAGEAPPGIAVLEGTTRLLRCACASGHQDRFVGALGPRLSTQGQAPAERLRSPHRCRNVALS